MSKEFAKAEGKRVSITNTQRKQIKKMYADVLDDISSRIKFLESRTNVSSILRLQYLQELQSRISSNMETISKQLEDTIQQNMLSVANSVVQDNVDLLRKFGYSDSLANTAFMYVPQDVVNEVMSGKLYEGKWSLSKSIWKDNALINKDLETIVAKGIAENKSAYDIAKDLEKYVNPSAKKTWDWSKVYPGTRKVIDYNAQRLARTMVSHAYEESFVRTTKNNPFIESYKWVISNSDRVCPLCISRAEDDQYGLGSGMYPKDQLPLDHPNGMCTFEAIITKSYQQISDELADWALGKTENKQIDNFAEQFGYKPSMVQFSDVQKEYLEPYGFSPTNMPKSFDDWSHKVSYEHASAILEDMGTSWSDPHPYQQLMKYYNKNLAHLNVYTTKPVTVYKSEVTNVVDGATFASKYGTSSGKTFNYWYTKLDKEAKEIAKQLKDESGLTWQQWYEKNIFTGKVSQGTESVSQKINKKAQNVVPKFDKNKLMDKMLKQTTKSSLEMEDKVFDKLPSEQKEGLTVYTGSSFTEMNSYLRYVQSGKSHSQAKELSRINDRKLKHLKNAYEGLGSVSLEKDMVLRRGTDLGDLAGFMAGDFKDNLNKLFKMSLDELKATFEGTTGVYAGFTSTSSVYEKGFSGDVEVVFNAPKGTHASSIMKISQYGTSEGETLLNAGTKVLIRNIEESDGHFESKIRVYMDIIGNEEIDVDF